MINSADIHNMSKSPQKYFDHPNEILFEAYLTTEEKIKVLESWMDRLNKASDKNVPGNPAVLDISEALKKLTH